MAHDNPQQSPHKLRLAEVEAGGSTQIVQVPLGSSASGSPNAGGSAGHDDHV